MISVIIPSYNRADTIERSARSVLNQTYKDLELIIVDDCSSDSTPEVVSEIHDPRVRYIRHQRNLGACAARNTGIEAAKGEYIAFQDSDDTWRPKKLELQMRAIEKYDSDVCFCKIERHDYPKNKERFFPDLSEGDVKYDDLLMKSLVSTQTILAKSKVFLENFFDVNIKRLQDYDWVIRTGQHYKFCFIEDIGVDAFFQMNSISNSGIEKLCDTYCIFEKKYNYLFKDHSEWELLVLKKKGKYKAIIGKRCAEEYRRIWILEPSLKNYLKMNMAKLGILSFYYKHLAKKI